MGQQAQAQKTFEEFKRRLQNPHHSLLRMVHCSLQKQSNLCSTSFLISLYFQFPSTNLFEIHRQSLIDGKAFSSQTLFKLAMNILEGLKLIHSEGKCHGDIRPELIGCGEQFFIVDNFSSSIEQKQFGYLTQKKLIYVSPEMYQKLTVKKNAPVGYERNDLFCLGMVLLQLGTLKNIKLCYGERGAFLSETLFDHLQYFD